MTTIAYRAGIIAADTLSGYGDWKVPGVTEKLHRFKDGSVGGMTGSESLCRRTIDWIERGRSTEQPQPSGEQRGAVILMHPAGSVEIFEDGAAYFETAPFMAYGSGQPAALAALHMGASAKKAVSIAMLVDKHSGGQVRSMSVGKVREKK